MKKVVHVKRDPFDVYIGRTNRRAGLAGSAWANPFRIGDPHPDSAASELIRREDAVRLYREWILRAEGRHLLRRLGELEGENTRLLVRGKRRRRRT